MGPVMIDIKGFELDATEKQMIANPLVGGIILFTRNFENIEQIQSLINDCKSVKNDLIIAIDHEGGRVQRFRTGFTALPPMSFLGDLFDKSSSIACDLAFHLAVVLAYELKMIGVNLSFTPVLDLHYGHSEVIGNRSFHRKPEIVTLLNQFFIKGLHFCGFPSVGKHFPGHGYVNADSHLTLPVDDRQFDLIINQDVLPYKALIDSGLDAVMPAHVVYSQVDQQSAGFSSYWLQSILRDQLHFDGVIFSDDLAMEGAVSTGTPAQRAQAAFKAGCDMVLICNKPSETEALLDGLKNTSINSLSLTRLEKMMAVSSQSSVSKEHYNNSLDFVKTWI
ncbi:beta-hexosaminidase [Ferrovum sp. PN-J185]|nr:beta-hexosaminidase [Ferrovum sp. PN-J185]